LSLWKILALIVGLEHVGFLVLEMFLWRLPVGRKIFALTKENAELMAPLAANQGLYNGFLAAGLFWAALGESAVGSRELGIFFLGCVIVAGLYGGATVKRSIWFLQALPAAIALLTLVYAH
jgi:putative membrane protein